MQHQPHTAALLQPLLSLPGVKSFHSVRGAQAEEHDPYSGFNICTYTGDAPGHTRDCLNQLSALTGIDSRNIIMPRQTHSCNCAVVEGQVSSQELEGVDAIVTRRPHLIIGVNTADCLPLVLADPVNRVIGVAHAGWRGAVGGIVEATLDTMINEGADPRLIHAAFGPHICVDCFEVGEEVAMQFGSSSVLRSPDLAKPHVNLHSHVTDILLGYSLDPDNIGPFNHDLCTRHNPLRFFSARHSGIKSGRVFTFAYLD